MRRTRKAATLSELNGLALARYLEVLGGVFERSPWVAERSYAERPFASVESLHAAMMRCVREAPRDERLALARAHPELAGREASEGSLTRDSSSEQGRLGFTALTGEESARLRELNRRYRETFGFPCIVALRLHAGRGSVIAEIERRLANDGETELANALEEIGHIARGRLARLFGEE
jgi:chitin deacetylase